MSAHGPGPSAGASSVVQVREVGSLVFFENPLALDVTPRATERLRRRIGMESSVVRHILRNSEGIRIDTRSYSCRNMSAAEHGTREAKNEAAFAARSCGSDGFGNCIITR